MPRIITKHVPFVVTATLLLCISGCSMEDRKTSLNSSEERTPASQTYTPHSTRSTNAWANLTPRYKLPSVQSIQMADSWEQRLSTMPADARDYLVAFNDRYFGLLEFSSKEQQVQMMNLGFPMPEELWKARHLTDTELQKMADSGNIKAKILYADRLAVQARDIKMTDREKGPNGNRLAHLNAQASIQATEALKYSRSPFAAYVAGYQRTLMYDSVAPIVASLFIGRELGDHRAGTYIRILEESAPNTDISEVYAVYNNMRADLETDKSPMLTSDSALH